MNNIKKFDYKSYLNSIKRKYKIRIPEKNYKFPYSSYDIVSIGEKYCIFSLYQNNALISIDSRSNFKIIPIEIDHCHSIFFYKQSLVASCYRKNKILIFNSSSYKLIRSFYLKNDQPISSILYGDNLIFIDYFNSNLKFINLRENFRIEDNKPLLLNQQNPHSLKMKDNVIVITFRDPPRMLIYEGLNLYKIKNFESDLDVFSSYPINKNLIIIISLNKGIYLYKVLLDSLILISDQIERPTSLTIFKGDLFVTSESSNSIHQISDWESILL